jgi:predicted nucleic acid-binding protein
VIVVDASVAIDVLLRTPGSEAAAARLLDSGEALHAPQLIDIEVVQVLRRLTAHAGLSPSRALEAVELFAVFPITRYAHTPLLRRIWQLRENFTAYDAAYVALAEGLGATLVTRDKRLARTSGVRAKVELL